MFFPTTQFLILRRLILVQVYGVQGRFRFLFFHMVPQLAQLFIKNLF